MKKRARVVKKMEKLEIAIAGLVVKPNIAMRMEIATPPPPTPATFDRAMMMEKTKMPAISRGRTGSTSLWPHSLSVLTPQMVQG